ncbi:MAG: D-alanyl-D-alanine carboxypeptidase family protein [Solobacterium sp.]|nr:D-alanyl-D-alanine carboxypeptidase family protein [Solobacterium sp.]
MCEAGITNGTQFFVTTSYRSYDTQETAYKTFLNTMSEAQADAICNRAGFSEHQTGLAINVAATYETDKDFIDTNVYSWLKATCANYGWIARYPEEKKILTGMGDEPDHFRYLGRDLALAVTESKLTYDEYYCLYLKSWEDEANKPAEDILNATDYHNRSSSPVSTASPQETPEATPEETETQQQPAAVPEETPAEQTEETTDGNE